MTHSATKTEAAMERIYDPHPDREVLVDQIGDEWGVRIMWPAGKPFSDYRMFRDRIDAFLFAKSIL